MTAVDGSHAAPSVTATGTGHLPDEPELGGPGRWRRGLVWVALGGVLVAAAGAGAWRWAVDSSTEPAPAGSASGATATVERGTISATESWEGTLDHGTPFTVKSSAQGTVTRLAAQGAPVAPGDELFRVDEQPVILLSGAVPMYRDLGPGDSGADAEQLEANLAALGYSGFTADAEYTASTAEAVRAWQADRGAVATGMVARGSVVFAPEGGQVDTLRSNVGDMVAPGAPVLDITGTDQVVSLTVDVDDVDRFDVDGEVSVVLPSGDEVTGTVSRAAVVEAPQSRDPSSSGGDTETETDAESIVEVEIALDENASDELVGTPVEVVVAVDERTDVLLVPVNALLALAQGGYGLEVMGKDGTSSIVPVETGLFAEGKVEVRSDDVAEGTVLGVAGR